MPTTSPRVTIGVPVYNGERYLRICLDSLVSQTFSDIRIIVCDNASTDRTGDIARQYAERDARVQYHRNPVNIGCPRNFTRVVELCTTPFFRWASVDDLSAPTFVERCMEVLEARPDVVQAYPRTLTIDGDGRVTGEQVDDIRTDAARPSDRYLAVTRRLGRCNAIYGVIRTEVLRRTAVLGTYIGSDITFQAELALYGAIAEVPEALFFRRMHAQAQSAMSDEERARHYDPSLAPKRARKTSSLWRHLWERTRSVVRAPIAPSEKIRILEFLARDAVKSRDGLAAEAAGNARRVLRWA
ncbi:MAG TPA: glycosyltransferase [Gemmatimonadaceae bacterium]|jgi:glycosyltransferase involved in cell wall biosynthesis|nr:glycosyltransferase [Gemmatimonadaceae bacterium]